MLGLCEGIGWVGAFAICAARACACVCVWGGGGSTIMVRQRGHGRGRVRGWGVCACRTARGLGAGLTFGQTGQASLALLYISLMHAPLWGKSLFDDGWWGTRAVLVEWV